MRQKKNTPIPSSLESGTSQSTENPSAYAPPSISKNENKPFKPLLLQDAIERPSSIDGFKQGEYDLSQIYGIKKEINPLYESDENTFLSEESKSTPEFASSQLGKKLNKKPLTFFEEKEKQANELINDTYKKEASLKEITTKATKVYEQQVLEKENFENQLKDPNIPKEVKEQLYPEYESLISNLNQNSDLINKSYKDYTALQKTRDLASQAADFAYQNSLSEKEGILDVGLKSAYNAILPATIKGVAALTSLSGQASGIPSIAAPTEEQYKERLKKEYGDNVPKSELDKYKNMKLMLEGGIYSVASNWLMDFSDDIESEVSKESQGSILEGFTPKKAANLVGQGVGSMVSMLIPTGVVGKAGKAAQVGTAWGASSLQTMGSVYEEAKNRGLSDGEAAYLSAAIAIPVGAIDAASGTKFFGSKVAAKKLVSDAIEFLGKEQITEASINTAVKKTIPNAILDFTVAKGKDIVGEGATEAVQQELEIGGKKIFDAITGQEKFKDIDLNEALRQGAEAFVGGSLASAPISIITGSASKKSIYDAAIEMKNNQSKKDYFDKMIFNSVKNDVISQEEADNINRNISSIVEADSKIPASITDKNKRLQAVNLISEKSKIESEIKNADPALVSNQKQRIDEINSELSLLAKGSERVSMERKPLGAKEKITVSSVNDKKPALDNKSKLDYPQTLSDDYFKNEAHTTSEVDNISNKLQDKASEFDNGMEDLKNELPTEIIDSDKIVPTQKYVYDKKVDEYGDKKSSDLPVLIKSGDKYYVEDGHNRIAADIKNGRPIEAKIYDENFPKKEEQKTIEPFDGKDYSKGKKSEDVAKEQKLEFSSPEEIQRHIAENSENPLELASEYLRAEKSKPPIDYKGEQINDYGIKMTDAEFNQYWDKNNKNFTLAKKYIDNKSKIPLDVQLQELSEMSGVEITIKDLFDHIAKSEIDRASNSESNIKTKFKNRFSELTGKDLTPILAKNILEQEAKKINKDYEKFIEREYRTYEEAEQGYYDAIKSGELSIEGGEVVSVPVGSKESEIGGKREARQRDDGKIEKPLETPFKKVKTLASELANAENIPQEIREKIKDSGLTRDVFSSEQAKEIASEIIKYEGVESAVDLAKKQLKGSVKAFVFGEAIDHYSKMVNEAKTTEEKEYYAELGAEVAGMFEEDSMNYGRYIAAIGEYYKNHPDIIKKRETKRIEKANQEFLKRKKDTSDKIDAIEKELNVLKESFSEKVEAGVNEEFNKIAEKYFSKEDIKKVDDVADDLIAKIKSGTFASLIPPPILIGAVNVVRLGIKGGMGLTNAIQSGIKYIKDNYSGEINEKDLTDKLTKQFSDIPKDVKKSQSNPRNPKVKSLKEEQEKILNKYFPKKLIENPVKRKKLHEKIIDQYNAGLFEGGVNKDGETFESLFYEKLGILNPNSKEIQDKLGEFSVKLSKAPEGSIYWRETNQDMLNYLANIAYETRLKATGNKLSSMWYANILSSPATHLRNMQYNIIQTIISQPFLLAEKALLKKDYKAIASIFSNMSEGFKKGKIEGGRVLTTGRGSRFDSLSASDITERGSKFMKYFTIPGRALRSSDILFTDATYAMKMGEVARNMVKSQYPNLTEKEVSAKVNELLGETKERKELAKQQAEKEAEEFYGKDWKNIKGIEQIQKIREFELMEESRPKEFQDKKEEAVNWAKKSLLTSKPTGIYGVVSDMVQKMNDKLWFTKFVIPFVNVPLNVVNGLIERSPVGFIKAIRGKEGFGDYAKELTKDQKQELFLKATNYTVMLAVLALANGDDDNDDLVITGEQTGNYTDNKGIVRGGKLKPYTVNINGVEVFNYKTSPWAAVLMPVGYMRDYKVYGENKSKSDALANVIVNYLLFANEQSAMQGVSGMFEAVSNAKKANAETVSASLGKLGSGFIPYSGAVKFLTNTVNAATGEDDKRPIVPYENIMRDLPFVQSSLNIRKDHFGQPVKETLDIPLAPIGGRGQLAQQEVSPYYKLTSDHKYNPHWLKDRKIYINGKEVNMSAKELDALNARRGEIVKEALDSKNIFISDSELDSDESKMTTMEYMNGLDNERFKLLMDKIFEKASYQAKLEKYGAEMGVSKSEMDKYQKKVNKLKELGATGISELSEIRKNKEELEKLKEGKSFTIDVESY